MAGKGVPIFDGTDFTTWKPKLLWYLGSIHDEMERVLTEGSIIPGKWIEEVSNVDGTVVKPAEFIQTPRTQWTEQDAILYRLDSKIRSIIGNAISVPILRKVGHAKTVKAMWDILLNDFKGVTVVKTQKKKNFVRSYENFNAEPKESLFDLHSRFQVLINDLEGAGVTKTQAELCQKFVDALPETFESIITSMVVSEKLDNYDLSGLFGILTNFEEIKLKKKINAKKIAKDPDAALVATTKRNKELFSSYSTKAESDEESDDSSEDEEVQILEEQMALLTQRIEKKKFGPRKGKSPFDPKKATCFKCGKVGHNAAECWSKVDSSSNSVKHLEKAKKYKKKYKNLKKEGVKPVVQNFVHYVDNEKISMFKYLLNDFKSCLDENKRLKSELNDLKVIVREKDLHISETEQCRIELAAYKSSFNKEIIRFDDEKTRQIPADIKDVLGVGFDLKNDIGIEKDPNRFKHVILHNTFLKVDGDKQYLTDAFVRPESGFIYSTETILGSKITHDSKSEKQKCFEVKAITKLKKRISKLCKKLKDKPKVKTESDKPKSPEKVRKWIKLDKQCSNIQDQCKEKIVWIKNKPFVWRVKSSSCEPTVKWVLKGCKEHLEGFIEEKGPSVRYGDNSVGKTIGYGSVKVGGVTLKRVALVEGLMHNLLSVSQVADEEFDLNATNSVIDTCLYSQTIPELNWLWHRRLSHLNFKNINELSKKGLVRVLPQLSYKKDKVCSACVKGKQTKAHFHSKTLTTIDEPLHMLHMDLFRPMNIGSLSGKKYPLEIVDEYSRLTWVIFLYAKSDAPEEIINLIKKEQVQKGKLVKQLRSDHGTEFKNATVVDFCESVGIGQNFSSVRTPQQNGVAERRNRTLIEDARTMLCHTNVAIRFWAEAVNTACYTQNKSIIVKKHGKTPYELYHKKVPTVHYF
ncbi:uncharacterized protein [Rutidosis leptorrhynchoides]|uniref:uncharacterized protein n=1 Tax=Rutidosis leptorrhynchoides TaxID=125765 RepID=UPI003A99CC2B